MNFTTFISNCIILYISIKIYIGNAKTQRGINASIIILDEAAFIPPAMLQEVI